MSKDLRIKHKCPHYVVEEWLELEQDRQTLYPVRFPSSKEIKILWNRLEVPREGLVSNVEISGLERGPFDIDEDNDTVRFSVDGGAIQEVEIPRGRAVKASQIARVINQETTGIEASDSRGRLTLALHISGPDRSLKMQGGTAHETLGIPALREYKGRTIVPPWELVKDRERGDDPMARKIVFREPLRTDDDEFEVSYYTLRGVCRRCNGLGVENDFRYDQRGRPLFVENQQLLLQEVEKIIFTVRGSNVFHRWYGTNLTNMVGSKIVGGGNMVEAQLVSEISNTISRYQQIKDRQGTVQPVSRAEKLNRVVAIDVSQGRDPTVFFVNITLQSMSGQIESFDDEFVISDASFADGFQFAR